MNFWDFNKCWSFQDFKVFFPVFIIFVTWPGEVVERQLQKEKFCRVYGEKKTENYLLE